MKKSPLIPQTKNAAKPKAPEQQVQSIDTLLLEYTDHGRRIRQSQDRQEEIAVILRNEIGARQAKIQELTPAAG